MRNYAYFTLLLLIFGGQALGNAGTSTTKSPEIKKWSALMAASLNSGLAPINSPENQINADLLFVPSYKFGKKGKLFLALSGNKALEGERKFKWNDASLFTQRSFTKIGNWSITGRLYQTIPLSDSSRKDRILHTATKVEPKASYTKKKFSMSYAPSFRQYFYKFKVSKSGKINNNYALSQKLVLGYALSDRVSIAAEGIYARAINHRGTSKDTYSLEQSISYSPTLTTSLTLGHATGGSPLAPNGQDTNIEFFDERDSTLYVSVGVVY